MIPLQVASWNGYTFTFACLLLKTRHLAKPEVNGEANTLCPLVSKGRSRDAEWSCILLLQEGGAEGWDSNPQESAIIHVSQKGVLPKGSRPVPWLLIPPCADDSQVRPPSPSHHTQVPVCSCWPDILLGYPVGIFKVVPPTVLALLVGGENPQHHPQLFSGRRGTGVRVCLRPV